jgi:hypothetical protein
VFFGVLMSVFGFLVLRTNKPKSGRMKSPAT